MNLVWRMAVRQAANAFFHLKYGRPFGSSARLLASVQVTVDGKTVEVPEGSPLIHACDVAGVEIPRFCYHERLAIAGNCRMCLVEVEKSAKPVASCAMPVGNGMKIFTNTPMVKKAREGVMEFLLANHPLDCPICDQGGECDLQDQSMIYGSDRGRFNEFVGKRAVEDKNFGPLVKTQMTRCIHCTRCVRFANDVAGLQDLGTTGRGSDMQISTYVEKILDSEMSGNIIDLCPVGALTNKPYAFKARPWELRGTETIDVHDAVGSHIRVDTRGLEVMRVLPRECASLNEEWISDKTRFACDGLGRQRLTVPLIKANGQFIPCTWEDAFDLISQKVAATSPSEMVAIAGPLADVESMVALRDLFHRLNATQLIYEGNPIMPAYGMDLRSNYTLNKRIGDVEECDAILIVGSQPRHEAPILNVRLRKAYLNGANIGYIGDSIDATFEYTHLGNDLMGLKSLKEGHAFYDQILSKAQKPLLLVGETLGKHPSAQQIFSEVARLAKSLKTYSLLHRQASKVGALDIGFGGNANLTTAKLIYLLGAEENLVVPRDAFVIYQGHHGDLGAEYADIILPGAAYTEKCATFVNTEGRVQKTVKALHPPGLARNDWTIIRALSEILQVPLPYSTTEQMNARMEEIAPHLIREQYIPDSAFHELAMEALIQVPNEKKDISKSESFKPIIQDFYRTDSISRSSPTMAKCSAAFVKKQTNDTN